MVQITFSDDSHSIWRIVYTDGDGHERNIDCVNNNIHVHYDTDPHYHSFNRESWEHHEPDSTDRSVINSNIEYNGKDWYKK